MRAQARTCTRGHMTCIGARHVPRAHVHVHEREEGKRLLAQNCKSDAGPRFACSVKLICDATITRACVGSSGGAFRKAN